jgi:Na+-transporting NADH:ubiquinone oxidoreductase subunit F
VSHLNNKDYFFCLTIPVQGILMDFASNDRCTVDINSGLKKIATPKGVSLLSALAKNGVLVPSACGGNARCGACKIKVISGGGEMTSPESLLVPAQEKAAGFRLACRVKAENDLAIELPQYVFSIKQYVGKLVAKRMLTYDIVHLRIELIKPERLTFTAGQYIQVRSQPYQGKQAVVRAFSLASLPSDSTCIDLMIRKVPNGICTGWIFDVLKEGDKVYFTAPYGDFKLSDSSAPAIFIAGGSGMGPLWSMLQDVREKGKQRTIHYFFGALTQRDLFLVNELTDMQKELPGFTFIPALSNEPETSDWKGERGLITDVVGRFMPSCGECEAYLCGSPGMIGACIKVLTQGGMPGEKIYFDKFV